MSSGGAEHLLVFPYRANLSICERFIFLVANFWLQKCCLPYEIYSTITEGCVPYQEHRLGPSAAKWLANLSAYQQWSACFYSFNTQDPYSRYYHHNYRDRVDGWDQGWNCSVTLDAYRCSKENSSFSISWDLSYYCFEYVQEVGRFLPYCGGQVPAKLFIWNFLVATYVCFLILSTILMPLAVFLQVMLPVLIPLKLILLIQTMLTVIIAIFISDITFVTVQMFLYLIMLPPIILVIVTFLLYLIVPELRKKVQDKCLVCYLGSITMGVTVISYYIHILADASSIVLELAENFFMISGMSWLTAMSIHLWRSVRTTRRLPGRDFHVYSFFVYGWSALCILARIIHCYLGFDHCITGHNFIFNYSSNRFDPFFLYLVYPGTIELMINLCLMVHVLMIIWKKKREWNKSRNCDVQKHVNQQKCRFWKYLNLYSIAGLDWISFIFFSFLRSSTSYSWFVLCVILLKFTFCSGILIFCNFVYCNKKTMSILKSKFSQQVSGSGSK